MMLLEKQGLCSQQQRQTESAGAGAVGRCVSLPPSSLPRPKRHQKQFPSGKLGEYGRLSDSESGSRKLSTTDSEKTRDSPTHMSPRKLGEYGRLNDSPTPNESAKLVGVGRDSNLPVPKYALLNNTSGTDRRKHCSSPHHEIIMDPRESPTRKFSYGRYSEERKVSGSPTSLKARESPNRNLLMYEQSVGEERPIIKSRESSFRSLLPPPRKISEYSCFVPDKSSTNIESKLRIFSPNAATRSRRGSLQRERKPEQGGGESNNVKSLPMPNKYRIQF